MQTIAKTPGQLAYEADVQAMPVYHDGAARHGWHELGYAVQDNWQRHPTARDYRMTKPVHDIAADGLVYDAGGYPLMALWLACFIQAHEATQ
jgi:hypothetical protein